MGEHSHGRAEGLVSGAAPLPLAKPPYGSPSTCPPLRAKPRVGTLLIF